MNEKIFGSFTFHNYGDGCIFSKYLEHSQTIPFVESAKRTNEIPTTDDIFVGVYTTTWIEQIASSINTAQAELQIEKFDDVYDLTWRDINNDIIYEGKATLINEALVGSYWKVSGGN